MPCASCLLLLSLVGEFYAYPVIFLRQLIIYQEAIIGVQIQVKPNSELMIIQRRQTMKDVTTVIHFTPLKSIWTAKEGKREVTCHLLARMSRIHSENSESTLNKRFPCNVVRTEPALWGTRLHQQTGCTLWFLRLWTMVWDLIYLANSLIVCKGNLKDKEVSCNGEI